MRSSPTSAPKVPRVWPALGAIALAALLNPLNTSMIAVALVDVRHSFGVEVGASTWLLLTGAAGLLVGTGLMLALNELASAVMVGVAVALFGVPNAFSNLGLQADLTRLTPVRDLGVAGGLFQTMRFVGAGIAAGLIGLLFAHGATTAALHELAGIVGVPSVVLLAVAARRLVRDGFDQPPVRLSRTVIYDAGDLL